MPAIDPRILKNWPRPEVFRRELARRSQRERGWRDEDNVLRGGLMDFIRYFWHVIDPQTPLIEGQLMYAVVEHLEAVTFGDITRLVINVPFGCAKSVCTSVYWPAWEWAIGYAHHRWLCFSYSATLSERDNLRCRQVITSPEYQALYGDQFQLSNQQIINILNDKSGSKFASSVGGTGTGMRGQRVVIDDPLNVKEAESETVRAECIRWFRESISSRFNDLNKDALVIIMQRLHEEDLSGVVLGDDFNYTHLCIPWSYDPLRQEDANGEKIATSIGWTDWRTEAGQPAWPERFSAEAIDRIKKELGPYAVAGQLEQSPAPRGGGIVKREWFKGWAPANNKYPEWSFCLTSVDCAATSKSEADPTACTTWAVFSHSDTDNLPAVILVDSWAKRLNLHGDPEPRLPYEEFQIGDSPQMRRRKDQAYMRRVGNQLGLVEHVLHTARRFKVSLVLIEHEKSGIAVAQELRRLYKDEDFVVQLVVPKGDKYSRLMSVVPLFANGKIWAPLKPWAEELINEVCSFPRAKHDDLTDSTSMALSYLRNNNLLHTVDESRSELVETLTHRPRRQRSLYPV